MTPDRPLAQVGVLVTRPAAQSGSLVARLEALGARVVLFPALAILPTSRPAALQATLDRLDRYDLAIFISPSAAEWGLAAAGTWPSRLPIAAIGAGTARALAARGCTDVRVPETGADSEHLLSLPGFVEVAGLHILILRGEGGRELLAEALRARGAHVDYAECYRRARPQADPAPLLNALGLGQIHALTAFSGETLDNLLALLGPACPPNFHEYPLFVPHLRIGEHAARLGFKAIHATGPGESGLIAGLVEYFSHDRRS